MVERVGRPSRPWVSRLAWSGKTEPCQRVSRPYQYTFPQAQGWTYPMSF